MTDEKRMEKFWAQSHLFASNAGFVEDIYAEYLQDPNRIDTHWRAYFDSLQDESEAPADIDHRAVQQSFATLVKQPISTRSPSLSAVVAHAESKQVSVLQLINAFRFRGHQAAEVDPLALSPRTPVPDLLLSFHNLSDSDLDTMFNTGSLVGPEKASLREILQHISETYCHHIGAEYMHITSTSQKRWLQERFERSRSRWSATDAERRTVLERLIAAEGLEKYLHSKYVGQKRFSLEGGESLIPMLDNLLQRGGKQGVQEVVIGMAHRGRLNVLINVLGKSAASLFKEFEGQFDPSTNQGSGDVKYHQGFSSDVMTAGDTIHLALAFNPSHLEIIGPVVEGSVRARQQRRQDRSGKQVIPILIHGDAAFAGQGVVMETLQMSQARGYSVGGSIHIIINNQIGFTTSNPLDARSTPYCTEVARMVQAPIFHVNGDDPEAVMLATEIAFDFRQQFRKDVIIDLVCYRRHGHSEADEPAATQPLMYKKIRAHKTVSTLYAEQLTRQGTVDKSDLAAIETSYRAKLDNGEQVAPNVTVDLNKRMIDWTPFLKTNWDYPVNTQISVEAIRQLAAKLGEFPADFRLHPRVAKIMEERQVMAAGGMPMDWGFAETMAYAALLRDGFSVRISGQDSGRGTFFHRHAVLHHQEKDETYVPLSALASNPPYFTVIDSLLSEEAVLAFEYGFSSTDPRCLTIWEAQFGDFANNAQVVIDQFICSSESKWSRLSGLVMLLPHGFDGQGPEHSSARLERYLQLCAEENMQVCVPSVPAQMFHMLRRQMLRPVRKPLIVFTPKSLLRHRDSVSTLNALYEGQFHSTFDDPTIAEPQAVSRVIFCSGKVFFDLQQEQQHRKASDCAIVRVEQLYPFPAEEIAALLAKYGKAKTIVWCQEEPENQGAWHFIVSRLPALLKTKQVLQYAGRPAAAAPAVGYLKIHIEQQRQLIEAALSK